MNRIYFDNAATTPIDPAVVEAMMPYLTEKFGNPSSIYSYGRESKIAIESARKTVAQLLNVRPAEIFFTSGGTESDNLAIISSIRDLHCTHIITSAIEHHAVEHTIQHLCQYNHIKVSWVNLLPNGHIDLQHLTELLASSTEKTLVSLMHANNEIGNMLDLHVVGNLCRQYGAYFHSDTVQTVGHLPIDLRNTPVDFITGAGHKFHGPKGVGILYINENIKIQPLIYGGAQERNMRAGTENIYGIVGFAKALEIAMKNYEQDSQYILSLKQYMGEQLQKEIPTVVFNGDTWGNNLYTILNVSFPESEKSEMLLFNLDINHICVSGGSACSSGAHQGSHVIRAIYPERAVAPTIRFSFSKYNTKAEIDMVIQKLKTLL